MRGMQAEKLWHNEEQEEWSGKDWDEEVLQVLQKAYASQGDEVISGAVRHALYKIL